MEGRTALIAALISGALAVATVAVDLNFGMDASLQTKDDGQWVPVGSSLDYREPGNERGCANSELQLWVHNNRLIATDVEIDISYYSASGEWVTVLDETWEMKRGEERTHAFTIPAEAFETTDADGEPLPHHPTLSVNAYVNGQYLYTCVAEASQ